MFGFVGWLIISLILLISTIILLNIFQYEDGIYKLITVTVACTLTAIILIGTPIAFIVSFFTEYRDSQTSIIEVHNIKSLMNGNTIESKAGASFILASGYYSKEDKNILYYYTTVEYDGLGFKIEKYESDKTYIKEEYIEQPYLEIVYDQYELEYKTNWLAGGIFRPISAESKKIVNKYILHVPLNTIQVDWDVSLQNIN